MYIYHALINTLSTHMIHVNLNMIFCTHVEHSQNNLHKVLYQKKKKMHYKHTHTHTHNNCLNVPTAPLIDLLSSVHFQPRRFAILKWCENACVRVLVYSME